MICSRRPFRQYTESKYNWGWPLSSKSSLKWRRFEAKDIFCSTNCLYYNATSTIPLQLYTLLLCSHYCILGYHTTIFPANCHHRSPTVAHLLCPKVHLNHHKDRPTKDEHGQARKMNVSYASLKSMAPNDGQSSPRT